MVFDKASIPHNSNNILKKRLFVLVVELLTYRNEKRISSILFLLNINGKWFVLFQKTFVNTSTPKVDLDFSLYQTYMMFRNLGLDHLLVTDRRNKVVGMITRIELLEFRIRERIEQLTLEPNSPVTIRYRDDVSDDERKLSDSGATKRDITQTDDSTEINPQNQKCSLEMTATV